MTKKRKAIIVLIIIFIIYTIVWYIGSMRQYLHWKYDLWKQSNSWVVYEDSEKYDYTVALPYFLEFTGGNLAISPSMNRIDIEETDELYPESTIIIWMKPFYQGIDEIGVILVDGDKQRQVYLLNNKTAKYPEDQIYVDSHQQDIEILFKKANKMWDLSMPWGK